MQKQVEVVEYEDEIELIDLIKVIWKWKMMIMVVTAFITIAAGTASFYMTKIYKVSMTLDAGTLSINENNEDVAVDSLVNMKSLIEGVKGGTSMFNAGILDAMKKKGLKDIPASLGFDINIPKGSNNLSISYTTPDVETGKVVLNTLADSIRKKYQGRVDGSRKNHDNSILKVNNQVSSEKFKIESLKNNIVSEKLKTDLHVSNISNSISLLDAQKKLVKKNIKSMENRIADIRSEIVKVQKNSAIIMDERNKFMADSINKDNILTAMIYSNTIQQNISYANTLENSIAGVNREIYQAQNKIETIEKNLGDYRLQKIGLVKQLELDVQQLGLSINEHENQIKEKDVSIDLLKFKKEYVKNVRILSEPTPGLSPVKPKKKMIVALAFVAGLFVSLFASFILEFIISHKSEFA